MDLDQGPFTLIGLVPVMPMTLSPPLAIIAESWLTLSPSPSLSLLPTNNVVWSSLAPSLFPVSLLQLTMPIYLSPPPPIPFSKPLNAHLLTLPRFPSPRCALPSQNPRKPLKGTHPPQATPTPQTVSQSAIQRISEKLRSLGFLEQHPPSSADDRPTTGPGSAGEIFIPTPGEILTHRVGYTIDSSWSTPEHPVPQPGSGVTINRFHHLWTRDKVRKAEARARKDSEPPPTVAELTIPPEELKRLRREGVRLEKRLKIGKAGITEGIVNGIHERWRRSELVKIKCEDLCRMNMKRTHEILEKYNATAIVLASTWLKNSREDQRRMEFVRCSAQQGEGCCREDCSWEDKEWRLDANMDHHFMDGGLLAVGLILPMAMKNLYSGRVVCLQERKTSVKDTRVGQKYERKTGGLVVWRSGSIIILYRGVDYKYPCYFHEDKDKIFNETSLSSGMHNEPTNSQEASLLPMLSADSSTESPASQSQSSFIVGVGSSKKAHQKIEGELQLEEEADRLLDGLGPRFSDWWGCAPLPIDADLLPAVVPGFRKPFRLLPFGIKPKLTDREMTILKRLGRPLPCHFALGRNTNLQGLAVSMMKLWEKCEIAKIAIKRGVQNTNSVMMAEELKALYSSPHGLAVSHDMTRPWHVVAVHHLKRPIFSQKGSIHIRSRLHLHRESSSSPDRERLHQHPHPSKATTDHLHLRRPPPSSPTPQGKRIPFLIEGSISMPIHQREETKGDSHRHLSRSSPLSGVLPSIEEKGRKGIPITISNLRPLQHLSVNYGIQVFVRHLFWSYGIPSSASHTSTSCPRALGFLALRTTPPRALGILEFNPHHSFPVSKRQQFCRRRRHGDLLPLLIRKHHSQSFTLIRGLAPPLGSLSLAFTWGSAASIVLLIQGDLELLLPKPLELPKLEPPGSSKLPKHLELSPPCVRKSLMACSSLTCRNRGEESPLLPPLFPHKQLTGGTLLSRDREFFVFYRGKDFLPLVVSSAIEERRNKGNNRPKRITNENLVEALVVSEPTSSPISPPEELKKGSEQKQKFALEGTNSENFALQIIENRLSQSLENMATVGNFLNLQILLQAIVKVEMSRKRLAELETSVKPKETELDKEAISEEERYMLRKVGLRMNAFLLLGRRGVFDGTVENMHLHWKYRELVKIISKDHSIKTAEATARLLEAESGGILVAVERVSKGYAIIIYRGKNYRRPVILRPTTLPNKRVAMKRSLEAQRCEVKDDSYVDSTVEHMCGLMNDIVGNDSWIMKGQNDQSSGSMDKLVVLKDGDECSKLEVAIPSSAVVDENKLAKQSYEVPSETSTAIVEDKSVALKDGDKCSDSKVAVTSSMVVEEDEFAKHSYEVPSEASTVDENELSKESYDVPFKAAPLSNRERLILRKQALRMKKRPVLAVGRNNIVSGVAKTIRTHFRKHPLAIVNIKGRAEGTSVQELIFELEQSTGAVLVSREPNKVILYRGWGDCEAPGGKGKNAERCSSGVKDIVSPQLLEAIKLECGLQTST
ncbi:hypothetical protein ZIOFF_033217 [Zingiber officinale]|uniref:CRM domain-containing protein n=1 Tax=Zingiber officinale TaxID=94328 RepID=A0A8J5GZ99_ZINOF|nr:hypothetical protein ZIOFF_033217 [Zingiber officinale]